MKSVPLNCGWAVRTLTRPESLNESFLPHTFPLILIEMSSLCTVYDTTSPLVPIIIVTTVQLSYMGSILHYFDQEVKTLHLVLTSDQYLLVVCFRFTSP